MNLYELSRLPFKERFKVVNDLIESGSELHPDAKIVADIFEQAVYLFAIEKRQNVLPVLEDTKEELPSSFKEIYEIEERIVITSLPSNERHRIFTLLSKAKDIKVELPSSLKTLYGIMESDTGQRIFDKSSQSWCLHYPDFKRIADVMETYRTNEMLLDYCCTCPQITIALKADVIYNKCISFKVKLTKKILSALTYPAEAGWMWCPLTKYCIDKDIVVSFLKSYREWRGKIEKPWRDIRRLKEGFFSTGEYKRMPWAFYIENSHLLKGIADDIQKTQEDVLSLLISGKELVAKWDQAITLEYENNATEMSLYDRELEILEMSEGEGDADEEYCYAYTLECPICVFYVGIAADPKERFEQHIRGAFSDEAHLFKSQFIQKYHNEVKHNIVFEGTRRECKQFERNYIAENEPLGNMTIGGEG